MPLRKDVSAQKVFESALILTFMSFRTENRVTSGAGGQSGSEVLKHAIKHKFILFILLYVSLCDKLVFVFLTCVFLSFFLCI